MFVLAYRNDNGALRVGTPAQGIKVHTSKKVANVTAKHMAQVIGRTCFVLDLTDVIAKGDQLAADFEAYEQAWDEYTSGGTCESHDAYNCTLCGTYM